MRDSEQPVLAADGGLVLRPWRPGDAPVLLAAHADPAIRRWHRRRVDSIEDGLAQIADWAAEWAAETRACWIVTGESGQALGRLSLRTALGQGTGEVGYWILPAARGAGVAPRAVEAATTWAFEDLGLHRIELVHSVANQASCRVAAKAGYELEGTRRSALLHADGWHDMHLHARIAGPPAGT
jgi:[ribosomal protein S5]-alanine N-acetyltransferase